MSRRPRSGLRFLAVSSSAAALACLLLGGPLPARAQSVVIQNFDITPSVSEAGGDPRNRSASYLSRFDNDTPSGTAEVEFDYNIQANEDGETVSRIDGDDLLVGTDTFATINFAFELDLLAICPTGSRCNLIARETNRGSLTIINEGLVGGDGFAGVSSRASPERTLIEPLEPDPLPRLTTCNESGTNCTTQIGTEGLADIAFEFTNSAILGEFTGQTTFNEIFFNPIVAVCGSDAHQLTIQGQGAGDPDLGGFWIPGTGNGSSCAVRGGFDGTADNPAGEYPGLGNRDIEGDGYSLVLEVVPVCGDGVVAGDEQCDTGAANGTPDTCCSASCEFRYNHPIFDQCGPCFVGRATDGTETRCVDCSQGPATCQPNRAECPAEQISIVAAGTPCRPSADPICDPSTEVCDGTSSECPADDAPGMAGVVCRPSSGNPNGGAVCDPEEVCTGVSGEACPTDVFRDPDVFLGICRGSLDLSGTSCDPWEICPFAPGGVCPPDVIKSAGTVCRPSADPICDPRAEVCSGVSGERCPADDAPSYAGTVCNPGSGDFCDPAETCTGVTGFACPTDVFMPPGTVCRSGAGNPNGGSVCDPDETCAGVADAPCPTDVVASQDVVCRSGSGSPEGGSVCDPDETCPGPTGGVCPADVVLPATTVCRDALDPDCDTAEQCPGAAGGACPTDVVAAAGTTCPDGQTGDCFDPFCDGAGACDQDTGAAQCEPGGKPQCEITLGDFVWEDLDFDGNQDAEPGIEDVDVSLVECGTGTVLATDRTRVAGDYGMTTTAVDANCQPVARTLHVELDASNFQGLLAGYAVSPQDNAPDAVDSDFDPTTFASVCTTYPAGTNDATVDAGLLERIAIGLDIKPGSCPNAYNRRSKGVLPIALVGADDFDANQVDLSTIQLCLPGENPMDPQAACVRPIEGPPGPHTVVDDVATAFEGAACDCHELTADGTADVMTHFRTQTLVGALGLTTEPLGSLVELSLHGNLLAEFDGIPFEGRDCVWLVPPQPGALRVAGSIGAWVDMSPADDQVESGGFTPFERSFADPADVVLTAQPEYMGRAFLGWTLGDGTEVAAPSVSLTLDNDTEHSIEVRYAPAEPLCGLGFELTLCLPALAWLRRRAARA